MPVPASGAAGVRGHLTTLVLKQAQATSARHLSYHVPVAWALAPRQGVLAWRGTPALMCKRFQEQQRLICSCSPIQYNVIVNLSYAMSSSLAGMAFRRP